MDSLLRRKQNTLVTSGGGIILLGAWSLIKGLLTVYLQFDDIIAPEMIGGLGEAAFLLKPVMIGVSFVVLAFVLLLHIFIGINAQREGRGRRFRRSYVFFAAILLMIILVGLVLDLRLLFGGGSTQSTTAAAILMDLASLMILSQMLAAVISVRHLRNVKGEQ